MRRQTALKGRGGYRKGHEEQNRAVRRLSKQTSRQRPCSILPSTSGKISFVGGSADRRESGGGRLQPSLAMHKTNCWHKVTRHAEQGLVGRQEESIPPSLHLSIDIPGSPSSASGFCNYHQTAASRPPKHWLTARINRDVERPWRAVCVSPTLLCMCNMFQLQKLMCEFLCLLLSISWFCLHVGVRVNDKKGIRMECCINMKTSVNNNAVMHFN